MTINARLIATTQPWADATGAKGPEDIVSYCARVSSPQNQENFDTSEKLLAYCIRNKHWSIFQMVNALVEVNAPRDISRQLLRHESFVIVDDGEGNFTSVPDGFDKKAGGVQEFSQRYAEASEFTMRDVRRQDTKNRQNSIDDFSPDHKQAWANGLTGFLYGTFQQAVGIKELYEGALESGIAKECARVILPEGLTMSRLYLNGTLRSYLHYIDVRKGNGTQIEHQHLANAIAEAIEPAFPVVMKLAG